MKPRTPVKITRLLIAGFLAWALGYAGWHQWTAQDRFNERLDAAIWDLRQSSGQAAPLPKARQRELLEGLRSPIEGQRWAAAHTLASWKDRDSTQAIIAAMQDDEGTRRTCVVAQALGRLGDAEAIPALDGALQHPSNADLRICAAYALAEIGTDAAAEPLIAKAIDATQPLEDRLASIDALGDLGSPRALPALQQLAAGSDDAVREFALFAIDRIELLAAADPVPGLVGALENEAWTRHPWVIRQLAHRWDARVASALNRYMIRPAPEASLVEAAAVLVFHHALEPETAAALRISKRRTHRWLAERASGVSRFLLATHTSKHL